MLALVERWDNRRLAWLALILGSVAFCTMKGAAAISPDMSASEVLDKLKFYAEIGLGVGVVFTLVGGVSRLFARSRRERPPTAAIPWRQGWLQRIATLGIIGSWAAAVTLILVPHRPDNGRIVYRARFPASCGAIELIAFAPPLSTDVFGEVVVRRDGGWTVLALDSEGWSRLRRRWTAAKGAVPGRDESRREDGTLAARGRIDVTSGPPARFVVSVERQPTATCDLPAAQFVTFGQALDRVGGVLRGVLSFPV